MREGLNAIVAVLRDRARAKWSLTRVFIGPEEYEQRGNARKFAVILWEDNLPTRAGPRILECSVNPLQVIYEGPAPEGLLGQDAKSSIADEFLTGLVIPDGYEWSETSVRYSGDWDSSEATVRVQLEFSFLWHECPPVHFKVTGSGRARSNGSATEGLVGVEEEVLPDNP